MKQFIKHWLLQASDKVKCTKISLLRLILKSRAEIFAGACSFFGHIINPLLTKLVGQDGSILALFFFVRFYGPRLRLGP